MHTEYKTKTTLKLIEDVGGVEGLAQLLTPREVDVLYLRFGLCGATPQTLAKIAGGYSLIPERIRQIEAKALRKLQRHLKNNAPQGE